MVYINICRERAIRIAAGIMMLGLLMAGAAGAATLTVCPSGCTYSSIQLAINAASKGDTIFVQSSIYYENVNVSKQLIMRGVDTGGGAPIVDANGDGDVITITADGVTLEGFYTQKSASSGAGIYVISNNNIIRNNTASNNGKDISFRYSNNNSISNNTLSSYNKIGIEFRQSSYNKLVGNIMAKNNGIVINEGGLLSHYTHEIDVSNTVNGKPVYYWKDVDGGRVSDGAGQVILVNSKNVVVENQTLTKASVGIEVAFSSNITIKNNNISNNLYGIKLDDSNENNILNNKISSSNLYGIAIFSSSNNKLTRNIMGENGILIVGYLLSHYTHEIDVSNTVNGKPVYYWKDVDGGRVPDGAGQVILINSKNVVVENQTLTKASVGIEVAFSSNITIRNNNCTDNIYGIHLDGSNDNVISNNNCSSTNVGIYLFQSNYNLITNNLFKNNYNFVSGTSNKWNTTITSGTNIIGGSYLGGNFWANPSGTGFSQTCSDVNKDGICDSKYSLNANNIDYLPLAASDIKPPASITNLMNKTYATSHINWTWTDPADPDFSQVRLYLNGTFLTNVYSPQNYYNTTGLSPNTSYELGTHTVDTSGNVNQTWVNKTARTAPTDETPVVNFPEMTNPPTDPDVDGLYEDINGNGRKDFNDVVVFFNYLEWVASNEQIFNFDFNGNGRIDFNDIIKLFEEL